MIGCGVDWDCGQVFFVRNPTHEEPNTTDVFVCRFLLDPKETYPAVGTAPPTRHSFLWLVRLTYTTGAGEVARIDFGDKPFVFDVKTFIERKRAGLLSTLPHLRLSGS